MIKNSGENIKFKDSDTIRLQKVEARLDNFIREIDIHAKKLTEVKAEVSKLESQKEYLENQNFELNGQIFDLNNRLSSIKNELSLSTQKLEDTENRAKEINNGLILREQLLSEREKDCVHGENDLEKKLISYKKDSESLKEEKVLVEKAHKAIDTAIKSVPWLK